jgi:hypothetical protein
MFYTVYFNNCFICKFYFFYCLCSRRFPLDAQTRGKRLRSSPKNLCKQTRFFNFSIFAPALFPSPSILALFDIDDDVKEIFASALARDERNCRFVSLALF